MTTPVVGQTSAPRITTYITPDMFATHARRGVDVTKIVPNERRPDVQRAALAEMIDEASNWVDHIAQQILSATSDTYVGQYNVDKRGYLNIHPRYRPVIAVTAFALGYSPSSLVPFTSLAGIGVQRDKFVVPASSGALPAVTNQGPIQFGSWGVNQRDRLWCQYTYMNGHPLALTTAAINANDTTVSLADTTGVVQGNTWFTVYAPDISKRFTFVAGAVSTAPSAGSVGTGPGTVGIPGGAPFSVPLNADAPVMVSSMPPSTISAVVLAVRALIKDSNPAAATGSAKEQTADDDRAEATALLRDFVAPIA